MPEGAQERQNVPELLPKSNALPGTGARLFDPTPNGDLPNGNVPNGNVIPTPTPTPISPEQQKKNEARFAEIRSSAMQGARPIFLLQESRSALTDEARRNFLRAYYYSVCAEMRRMEPGLKSMVNTYEQEQIASLAKGRSPLVVANVHRSRQRPRTPWAPSLHRSQILRDLWAMQAMAAEHSGYAGPFCCFFWRESSRQFFFAFILNWLFKRRGAPVEELYSPQWARRWSQRMIFAG
jgi:hypothetical protein